MRWGAQLAFDALGWVITLGWISPVSAQSLDEKETRVPTTAPPSQAFVDLTWDAPEECPDREEILRLVQVPERASGRLVARATVHETAGEYQLSLTTQQEGQKGHRSLTASSCMELGEVTAALLSLSLATSEKVEVPPPPLPVVPDDAAEPESPPPPKVLHRTSPWVDLGLRGAWGPLPRSSAGPLLRVALERHFFRWEIGGYGLAPAQTTETGPGSSRYLLIAGVLAGCLFDGNRLSWGLCAGVEMGVIDGQSEGIAQPGRSTQPWMTPHAALLMKMEQGPFAFQLRPMVGVPIIRPQFSVEPFGTVFQPRAVMGGVDVSVGIRL